MEYGKLVGGVPPGLLHLPLFSEYAVVSEWR
jgi:hypothetical protein